MKNKGLIVSLLLMLALVVSGATYAYWASNVVGDATEVIGTVTIGSGNEATTSVNVGPETGVGPLVPATALAASPGGSVDFVILTFEVEWALLTGQATGATSTLSVLIDNVQIGGSSTYNSLVIPTFQIGGTVTGSTLNGDGTTAIVVGSTVNVYVKVTLTEPSNQTEYYAIAGENITFDITFTVAAITE